MATETVVLEKRRPSPLRVAAEFALSISSHIGAANRRLDNWIRATAHATPLACSLCGGRMARDRRTARLEWYRCTDCGLNQIGVQPGSEAA